MSEFQFLHDILDDLKSRYDIKFPLPSTQLKRQLISLNSFEKRLIKKKILDLEYNIGTLNVLMILGEVEILTATEFLQSRDSDEEIQAIICDLLDSTGSKVLLLEVILNSKSVPTISAQFQSCFTQYCVDIIERPELIKNEFLSNIQNDLQIIEFRDLVSMFIVELLEYPTNEEFDCLKVLSLQRNFCLKFEDENLRLLSKVISMFSANHAGFIAKKLCKKLLDKSRFNWFYLLYIIRFLDQTEDKFKDEFKTFLKSTFNKFCDTENVNHLYTVLIIARQLLFYHPMPFMSYKAWIKSSIGEVNYTLKNQEKFSKVIEALQNVIIYENDHEVLEVHCETAISSPRGCNHLILEYKQMLKSKIASGKEPEEFINLT